MALLAHPGARNPHTAHPTRSREVVLSRARGARHELLPAPPHKPCADALAQTDFVSQKADPPIGMHWKENRSEWSEGALHAAFHAVHTSAKYIDPPMAMEMEEDDDYSYSYDRHNSHSYDEDAMAMPIEKQACGKIRPEFKSISDNAEIVCDSTSSLPNHPAATFRVFSRRESTWYEINGFAPLLLVTAIAVSANWLKEDGSRTAIILTTLLTTGVLQQVRLLSARGITLLHPVAEHA